MHCSITTNTCLPAPRTFLMMIVSPLAPHLQRSLYSPDEKISNVLVRKPGMTTFFPRPPSFPFDATDADEDLPPPPPPPRLDAPGCGLLEEEALAASSSPRWLPLRAPIPPALSRDDCRVVRRGLVEAIGPDGLSAYTTLREIGQSSLLLMMG